jgi:hypothetical protein
VVEHRGRHEHPQIAAPPDAGHRRRGLVADALADERVVAARQRESDLGQMVEARADPAPRRGDDAAATVHQARTRERERLGPTQHRSDREAGRDGRVVHDCGILRRPRLLGRRQDRVVEVEHGLDRDVALARAPGGSEAAVLKPFLVGEQRPEVSLQPSGFEPAVPPGLADQDRLQDERALRGPGEIGIHDGQREEGHHGNRQGEGGHPQQQMAQSGPPHVPASSGGRIRYPTP